MLSLLVTCIYSIIDLDKKIPREKTEKIEPKKNSFLKTIIQELGRIISTLGRSYRWNIVFVVALFIIIYIGILVTVSYLNVKKLALNCENLTTVKTPVVVIEEKTQPVIAIPKVEPENKKFANEDPINEEPECTKLPSWEEIVKEHFENGNVQEINSLINTDASDEEVARRHIYLARLYIANSKTTEAKQHFQQAEAKYPSYGNFLEIATFYYNQKEFQEAISYYKECLNYATSKQDSAIVLSNKGSALLQNSDSTEAYKSYRDALSKHLILLTEDRATHLRYIATIYYNLEILHGNNPKEYSKAVESYLEALKIWRELAASNSDDCPDVVATLVRLSIFYLNKGDSKNLSLQYAKEAKEEALSCNPSPVIEEYINKANQIIEICNNRK